MNEKYISCSYFTINNLTLNFTLEFIFELYDLLLKDWEKFKIIISENKQHIKILFLLIIFSQLYL